MVGCQAHLQAQGDSVAKPVARLLKTLEEFRECERIQQEVWASVAASAELLSVTQKYGGVVLGAFAGRKMVGFLYALLAQRHGRLIHWSHMMAVRDGYRDLGLGFQMKLVHRKLALERGIKSICWTYDPLQSRNSYFNICRLGACIEEYVVDCYGRFPSAIEKGLPSDRFVANWKIASSAVERRLGEGAPHQNYAGLPRANETRLNSLGFIENKKIHLNLRGPQLLVAIPNNTDKMRAENPKLALRWRMGTRRIFEHYFRAGFHVENFFPPGARTAGACFYLLGR